MASGVGAFVSSLHNSDGAGNGNEMYNGEESRDDDRIDGDIYHYTDIDHVPSRIKKYWQQRHRIFSRYDEGIWMTDEDWFGVTPEPVAATIAKHIAHHCDPSKTILIDAFGGSGGNTIAFALTGRWKQIFHIEKNPSTAKCAKHNAEVYGVKNKIIFLSGDCFSMLTNRFRDMASQVIIFGSPPWGGQEYRECEIFDLETMVPYGLSKLHEAFIAVSPDLALYLPRTSNLNQIARYVKDGEKVQAVQYCLDGASKALGVYYGNFSPLIETQIDSTFETF